MNFAPTTALLILLCTCGLAQLTGQVTPQMQYFTDHEFTRADTLRGALRPERTSFDVTYYELHLDVNTEDKFLDGRVEMEYILTAPAERLQVDLFENMHISRIEQGGRALAYERVGKAIFVTIPTGLTVGPGALHRMSIYYSGTPTAAKNAPWDGGFVWSRDNKERTWVGVACEGFGASSWWPNKDYLGDEPDSMLIAVTVPQRFFVAANGNLRAEKELEETRQKRYEWFVSYPINNYNVSINIGHYVHFSDTYTAQDGEELPLDYYVLDYNLEKAKKQFEQVGPMLGAYEHYFGKYPFWEDGYALIETPYLGMEHQSGIAYGNKYMRGYLGGLVPADMDWDYIIIHETGHEYFGNSISAADHAEMWIHESFTTYMEALYVEHLYGEKDAQRYLRTQLPFIQNSSPILGPMDVNFEDFGGSDHYYKGAWVLHTLRYVLDDDPLFFGMLSSFYQDHQRSIVSTNEVVDYFNRYSGRDLIPFFQQYLSHPNVPTLELRRKGTKVEYRLRADVAGLAMPVGLLVDGHARRVEAGPQWQTLGKNMTMRSVKIDKDRFLVDLERVESR